MIANYHTHTARCGHAAGPDRAYVETAIARGVRILGFSDHIPMPFPDGHESRFRVPLRLLDDYVESILNLREEYKDKINIRLGFEAEYYPDMFDAMMDMLAPYPMDYLLLAQHYTDSREEIYNSRPQSDREALAAYVDRLTAGIKTGRFTYIAHPDLFRFTGAEEVYRREMRRLCRQAKELDIPLELNMLGLREGRNYPCDSFWHVAAEEKCRVVLGCDAHRPADVAEPGQLQAAAAYAARFGLVPETDIVLRKPL